MVMLQTKILLIFYFMFTLIYPCYSKVTGEEKFTRKKIFYDTIPSAIKGGSLSYSLSNDPKVMNPLLSTDSASVAIEGYIWMSLFSIDSETLDLIPALAKSYSVSADRKRYTFWLNEEARWQDGTPVTADDIKFTFDTLMNTKTHSAALRSYFEGVNLKIIDTYSFVFNVSEPQFNTLNTLASFTPIQKKQFENSKDFNNDKGIMNPIGNAAYIMSRYMRGQRITLKRNKGWWAAKLPQYKNAYKKQ
jgi:ABC-type transport system substrate-binding protein